MFLHSDLQAEVIFLGQLTHPHLVKLIGYCCEDEHRLLVYEYIARGNLDNQLFSGTYTLFYGLDWLLTFSSHTHKKEREI